MPNVLLNALASTAGGGVTYLKNVLPRLTGIDKINCYFAIVPPEHLGDYQRYSNERLRIETAPVNGGLLKRLFWEQSGIHNYIKSRKIDVLIALGNFALLTSPVPQILFSRNPLYFSDYFERDLKSRRLYALLIGNRIRSLLAKYSIKSVEVNVAPTKAFADCIRASDGLRERRIEVLRFGIDESSFSTDENSLGAEKIAKLNLSANCYRILYLSHYNFFRNFETLIRALPSIKEQIRNKEGKEVRLVFTTELRLGARYGGYDSTYAAHLIDRLGLRDDIAMLGSVPYDRLHHLYRLCDISVCPSYAESFGHPLLEAMGMGLPVVSADLAVHREVCGDAALYFDVFDENSLASQCSRVLIDQRLRDDLKARGTQRQSLFSWDEHVRSLGTLIDKCLMKNEEEEITK